MNHTLTNIEKKINSYLFPCPPQLRWKSHRPPSHRHTPCFIGSSLQVFLHRHTPYFIGSSLQVFLHRHTSCFIGSSLQAFLHRHTPCFIGSSLQAPLHRQHPSPNQPFHRPSPAIGNHLYKLAFIGYQSIQ